MDLTKLFATQKVLDEKIYDRFPELREQNNLDWKILALQTELGECANEWRGFKMWSEDRRPRTEIFIDCKACVGTGDANYEWIQEDAEGQGGHEYIECEDCGGSGSDGPKNPLLEEYVDSLHFTLSIGLEIGYVAFDADDMKSYFEGIIECGIKSQFIITNWLVGCIFKDKTHYEQALFNVLKLGEMLGFTWDQIESAYFDKNKINHARQDGGY